jgi:capsular exopolysaccharide synthesis family protein
LDYGSTEEVKTLVQRVFLLSASQAPHTVVFAGSESGSGCTWICARAAEALAQQVAGSVCLVDANLRAPGLHQQFGISNHHGLADALRQTEPVGIFVTGLAPSNLSIVSCGSATEGTQGLLTSTRMKTRLHELRSLFDYVLIDTPAINCSKEAIVLGAVSDGVVLVLKAHSSRKETARNAVQEFQTAKVRMLGAVLNQRKFPIPEAIYNKL